MSHENVLEVDPKELPKDEIWRAECILTELRGLTGPYRLDPLYLPPNCLEERRPIPAALLRFVSQVEGYTHRGLFEPRQEHVRAVQVCLVRLRRLESMLRSRLCVLNGGGDGRDLPPTLLFDASITFPDAEYSENSIEGCDEIRRLVTVRRPLSPPFARLWGRAAKARNAALWELTVSVRLQGITQANPATVRLTYWSNLVLSAAGSIYSQV